MHIGTPHVRSDPLQIPLPLPQQLVASIIWRAGQDSIYPLLLANYSEAYFPVGAAAEVRELDELMLQYPRCARRVMRQ